MASTIKIKNSSTASAVPTSSDLVQGELAINVTDKRMFTENSGGTVVELGTNPSSLTLSGGTANGVAYLNGSKVLTTGSALVFDGTNLGVGVTPSAWASFPAIQFVSGYSVSPGGFGQNTYYNAGFKNITTGGSTLYQPTGGAHVWYSGASGSAGSAISFTQAMTLDANGQFFVGATALNSNANYFAWSPGNSFADFGHVTGTASGAAFTRFLYAGTQIGSITQTGTSAVLYNTTSDYRLKTVIGAVSGAGERIDALEPVEYEWNSDGSRTRGFLAHKFQEVYAGSVSGTKDAVDAEGNPVYQSMQASSSEVIADLVAEIQSLRQRLAAAGI